MPAPVDRHNTLGPAPAGDGWVKSDQNRMRVA
jgi:hypothetical protein